MRITFKFLVAVAAGGLVATTAGAIPIITITPGFSHTLTLDDPATATGPTSAPPQILYVSDNAGKGAGYSALVDEIGNSVYFYSGSMSSGAGNGSTSLTEVTLNLSNLGVQPVNSITSTIFASAFGFYMAPFGSNPPVCNGAALPACQGATSGLPDFAAMQDAGKIAGGMAYSEFGFEVLVNNVVERSFAGQITATDNGNNPPIITSQSVIDGVTGNLGLLSTVLPGFAEIENSGLALLYSWDQSDFTVQFTNPIVNAGTITYRLFTKTWVDAIPSDNESSRGWIAAACIKDPLGRGGTRGAINLLAEVVCDDFRGDAVEAKRDYVLTVGNIDGNGNFRFTAAVPEPDTWAMLIVGFGLVGLSMRRTKKPVAATVSA